MKKILPAFLMGLWVSGITNCTAWAQATAQISGTVRDSSGAVLPGAEVTATKTETGISRTTVTNETGSYVMPNLALGPYRLEATLPGFRSFVLTGIVLQVNSSPVVNVVLEVEFRADAFNVTNSFVSKPSTTAAPGMATVPSFANLASNQFGQNLTAQETRKIQFALKYMF